MHLVSTHLGLEHQLIHIEKSSVIIRRLPIDVVRKLPLWSICPTAGEAPANELVPDGYRFRTMAQIVSMPLDWPVEVNYLEAKGLVVLPSVVMVFVSIPCHVALWLPAGRAVCGYPPKS